MKAFWAALESPFIGVINRYIQEEGTEEINAIETLSVDASRKVAREVDSTFN